MRAGLGGGHLPRIGRTLPASLRGRLKVVPSVAPEAPLVFQRAWMESVDGWPMAIIIHKTLGGKPKPASDALRRCSGGRYPPPEVRMLQLRGLGFGPPLDPAADRALGS